jgi:hypothetical protein
VSKIKKFLTIFGPPRRPRPPTGHWWTPNTPPRSFYCHCCTRGGFCCTRGPFCCTRSPLRGQNPLPDLHDGGPLQRWRAWPGAADTTGRCCCVGPHFFLSNATNSSALDVAVPDNHLFFELTPHRRQHLPFHSVLREHLATQSLILSGHVLSWFLCRWPGRAVGALSRHTKHREGRHCHELPPGFADLDEMLPVQDHSTVSWCHVLRPDGVGGWWRGLHWQRQHDDVTQNPAKPRQDSRRHPPNSRLSRRRRSLTNRRGSRHCQHEDQLRAWPRICVVHRPPPLIPPPRLGMRTVAPLPQDLWYGQQQRFITTLARKQSGKHTVKLTTEFDPN